MNRINFLTTEQEALIPEYQEKWQHYITSTEPIDREKAQSALNVVYQLMGKKAPKIVFCQSPYEVLQLKLRSNKYSKQGFSTNVAELNERFRSQSSFLWFFYCKLIIKLILTTVASALWNRIKPKNPIYKLQSQLNKSAAKYLSKKIEGTIPSQIKTEDVVEQGFNNAVEMMENQPQTAEIRERFAQFSRQSPENQAESFSTTASNTEERLNWLPLQNKFMRWWLKRFALGTLMNKVTIPADSAIVDPNIQRDLLQKLPQTLFQQYSPILTTQTGVINNI